MHFFLYKWEEDKNKCMSYTHPATQFYTMLARRTN